MKIKVVDVLRKSCGMIAERLILEIGLAIIINVYASQVVRAEYKKIGFDET